MRTCTHSWSVHFLIYLFFDFFPFQVSFLLQNGAHVNAVTAGDVQVSIFWISSLSTKHYLIGGTEAILLFCVARSWESATHFTPFWSGGFFFFYSLISLCFFFLCLFFLLSSITFLLGLSLYNFLPVLFCFLCIQIHTLTFPLSIVPVLRITSGCHPRRLSRSDRTTSRSGYRLSIGHPKRIYRVADCQRSKANRVCACANRGERRQRQAVSNQGQVDRAGMKVNWGLYTTSRERRYRCYIPFFSFFSRAFKYESKGG